MALYSAEDAKYLKRWSSFFRKYSSLLLFLNRRIRGGQIDVHPTEKALIVNYSIEATVLDEFQNTMIGDKKDAQKMYVVFETKSFSFIFFFFFWKEFVWKVSDLTPIFVH